MDDLGFIEAVHRIVTLASGPLGQGGRTARRPAAVALAPVRVAAAGGVGPVAVVDPTWLVDPLTRAQVTGHAGLARVAGFPTAAARAAALAPERVVRFDALVAEGVVGLDHRPPERVLWLGAVVPVAALAPAGARLVTTSAALAALTLGPFRLLAFGEFALEAFPLGPFALNAFPLGAFPFGALSVCTVAADALAFSPFTLGPFALDPFPFGAFSVCPFALNAFSFCAFPLEPFALDAFAFRPLPGRSFALGGALSPAGPLDAFGAIGWRWGAIHG